MANDLAGAAYGWARAVGEAARVISMVIS